MPRWQVEGAEAVRALAAAGPVVYVVWHEHLMLAPAHWQQHLGTAMMSVHDTSPIGRLAGELQPFFGSEPMAMSPTMSNLVVSRAVMRHARAGITIGITADGPVGPRRALKDAPIDWARFTGLPVVVYAFDQRRCWRLGTWDRILLPVPFGRSACVFAVVSAEGFSRRGTADDYRDDLASALNTVTARAAALVGH